MREKGGKRGRKDGGRRGREKRENRARENRGRCYKQLTPSLPPFVSLPLSHCYLVSPGVVGGRGVGAGGAVEAVIG